MPSQSKYESYPEPYESLYRIQRALAGYVSHLAACESNMAFTEYLLYEPILRVLMTQKYRVKCEFSCESFLPRDGKQGDNKKIDFVCELSTEHQKAHFALEVKWHRTDKKMLDVDADHEKLAGYLATFADAGAFLLVFGTHNQLKALKPLPIGFGPAKFKKKNGEIGQLDPIFAYFKRTQFGCKIYEMKRQASVENIQTCSTGTAEAVTAAPISLTGTIGTHCNTQAQQVKK